MLGLENTFMEWKAYRDDSSIEQFPNVPGREVFAQSTTQAQLDLPVAIDEEGRR